MIWVESFMVGIVIISENLEAREMLKTARRLLGRTDGITSVMMRPGVSVSQMQGNLEKAIRRVDSRRGVLMLVDFFGSTQCNVCMKFIKMGVVELVTGFNLPMLIKIGTLHQNISLKKLVPLIADYGRSQIRQIKSRRGVG